MSTQSHLAAYVSPFSDPPGAKDLEKELLEWQCIEAEEDDNGSDAPTNETLA